jgi:DNA-binding response OmpR family regulator
MGSGSAAESGVSASVVTERAARILIIDDSELTLELLSRYLEQKGFEAKGVTTLHEFGSLLKHWSPDLVLTDVNMKEMSGADLCVWIKERVETKTTPVVLYAARPQHELDMLRQLAGADYAISKDGGLDRVAQYLAVLVESLVF